MAIALVKAGTVATGTTTISPTFGQTTTAGNLLVLLIAAQGSADSTDRTPTGYTRADGTSGDQAETNVYFKANCGAGETAPTYTDSGATSIAGVLAEFSGVATTSPLDQHISTSGGITSPQTATTAGADVGATELVLGIDRLVYSMAATKTTTNAFNNGATATDLGNNDGTSSANHYRFSYGINTGNSTADVLTCTFTTTNISGAARHISSYQVAGAAAVVIPALTMAPLSHG
jgi:hypothetical protein